MNIRKITSLILGLSLVVFICLSFAGPVFAADNVTNKACDITGQSSTYCQQNGSDPLTGPDGTITKVIRIVSLFGGIAAVIMIIIGGLMYVLSGGDSNSVKTAKNTIIYAVVGLVIMAAAQAIVIFVISKL